MPVDLPDHGKTKCGWENRHDHEEYGLACMTRAFKWNPGVRESEKEKSHSAGGCGACGFVDSWQGPFYVLWNLEVYVWATQDAFFYTRRKAADYDGLGVVD